MSEPRRVSPKNIPEIEVIEIVNHSAYLQNISEAERATMTLQKLENEGLYKARDFDGS
jgi:hypothetical protein